jgi:hypothetical protein
LDKFDVALKVTVVYAPEVTVDNVALLSSQPVAAMATGAEMTVKP